MNLDSETPPENGRHLRLLLVEDNPGDARLIAELLKEVPHRTYAIEHAERLDEIAAKPAVPSFDAVLLDLGLPDSQGIETYHAARQILPDVPIILLTGLDDDGIAEKSLRAGAQDYLVKGKIMDPYLLDRTVRHARERYRMQLQLEENARQLKLSEDRLQHIIEDHSGGILVLDEQHTVVYANHSAGKILGQERESLLRQPFAYCTDSHNCNEINFTKPTGEIVVVEIRTIKTEWNGEPAFLVCLEDITDRKRMMEQLIQQQKNSPSRSYRPESRMSSTISSGSSNSPPKCLYGIGTWIGNSRKASPASAAAAAGQVPSLNSCLSLPALRNSVSVPSMCMKRFAISRILLRRFSAQTAVSTFQRLPRQ